MKTLAAVLFFLGGTAVLSAVSFDDAKDAFGRQDWKAASSLLGQFVNDHPDDPQAPSAAFLRAVALYQLGDPKGALDGFQKLERRWPQSAFAPRLPYWKGTAALAAGQYALAERELADQAKYPDEQPFATRSLLNLALARVALGKADAAVTALEAFVQASHEGALLSQAWALWADEDKKAGRLDDALAHYQKAWEAQPRGRWDLSSRTAAVDLLTSAGRFADAKALVDASAAVFPNEANRWDDRRIVAFRGLGDTKALAVVLETRWAREKDPGVKQTLAANRARVAEEAGTPDAGWWLKAAAGPDEARGLQALVRHAFLVESSGQWAAAASALEAWAASRPHAGAGVLEEARNRAAQDRLLAGDRPGARKLWDKLLAAYPQSPRVPAWLLARGRAFLDDGDTGRALVDFTRLLKDAPRSPEAPEARYQTGLVYLKRQEPARAEAWFYALVQDLKSGDLYQRALLARGVAFVDAGKTDLARGSLQRLVREAPQGPWTGAAWAALARNALQARLFDEAADASTQAEALLTSAGDKAQALWSLAEAKLGAGATAAAAEAFGRYARDYPSQPRVGEALYRQGAAWATAKDWETALAAWTAVVDRVAGTPLAQVREGMAQALIRLGRAPEGWDQLVLLETAQASPDAWYRWGQTALSLNQSDWATKAFQYVVQTHPTSAAAEAALPRAAGALLGGGRVSEALDRYADYFGKFGRQPSSAPVARAAAAAALAYPDTLEALVKASRSWPLAPEVAAEFSLVWAQSRLDSDSERAQGELQTLSQTAPWTSQRSEALGILGRWHLARGRLVEARTTLEAASSQGDDLSVFKARWALAQVTEKEGDAVASARQREALEKASGPGVPVEFRIQVLNEAADLWTKAGRSDDVGRVKARVQVLTP